MAANRYQKFLYAIELQGQAGKIRNGGQELLNTGWTRESPRVTSPYVVNSSPTTQKVRKEDTKEARATPAGTYYERDLEVIHGNIINTAARFTARRRGAGN